MVHVWTFGFQTLSETRTCWNLCVRPKCPKSERAEIQTGFCSDFSTVWNSNILISDIHCTYLLWADAYYLSYVCKLHIKLYTLQSVHCLFDSPSLSERGKHLAVPLFPRYHSLFWTYNKENKRGDSLLKLQLLNLTKVNLLISTWWFITILLINKRDI